ncbi:putative reverse transcriptase domain-containing protein [Tanacetum coccineum]
MIDQGVTATLAARDANRNGDNSHTSGTGGRRTKRVARECTYQDFMKCKPLYFKGTEGFVKLIQWFERMETVFRISNCFVENQIKFSTCTLLAGALTWWNSTFKTIKSVVAYATDLGVLEKRKMTNKYCPRNEMKKIKAELWNLKVKGTDVIGYNQCFQELALLCVRMFPEESNKIERYVGGLPDMIHGNIVASKPKTMQEAVEMATELMDKKVSTIAERQDENKRKSAGNANNAKNQRGTGSGQKPTCFECGVQGHFKKECPKLRTNKTWKSSWSFVSTAFSSQIDITPSTLDHYYDVELANGRIIGLNTILRGCTLNLLNHPFNINLMPIELGSFDAIIGMDWLAKYQAIIVCAEKIVRIPWGNEILIIHADGSNRGNETRLNIILCTKTQKYLLKGCPIFLAHVTTKKAEDKSEEQRLEDVPHPGELRSCLSRRKTDHFGCALITVPRSRDYCKGIQVDPARTVSFKGWAISLCTNGIIRQFLGLAGYYQRFIEGFSKIAKPMTKLTQKKVKFVWGDIKKRFQMLYAKKNILYDRVMTPLVAQLEQKPRRDRGTRRGRHSTSSSSAFDQPSSSHLNDDDDDGNDEGTSRASTLLIPRLYRFFTL